MRTTIEVDNDITDIAKWLDRELKGWTINDARKPVSSLLWAYLEALEQNRILNKVLIEAVAHGIELRAPPVAQAPKEDEPVIRSPQIEQVSNPVNR